MGYKSMDMTFTMWRWLICLLFLFPFLLLPFLWTTFPTHCSDGHIHYAEGHIDDADVIEPGIATFHAPLDGPAHPNSIAWAVACGPTGNGTILLAFIFIAALGLFLYCSPHSLDVEYGTYEQRPPARSTAPYKNTRGLEGYPLR